jgi:hypothetical protein
MPEGRSPRSATMRRMPRAAKVASISLTPARVEPMQDRCGAAS